jgi:hypothetical protein
MQKWLALLNFSIKNKKRTSFLLSLENDFNSAPGHKVFDK